MYGCSPQTTNNRMELTAAIEGLPDQRIAFGVDEIIRRHCAVAVARHDVFRHEAGFGGTDKQAAARGRWQRGPVEEVATIGQE